MVLSRSESYNAVLVWCGVVRCDMIHHYIASFVWYGIVLHGIV
jgi:hypothetical protein